jgi:hypothetical protein
MITRLPFFMALAALTLAACDGGQTVNVIPTQVSNPGESSSPSVDDAARFGFQRTGPAAAQTAAQPSLSWEAPEGWTQIAAQQFRDPNFKIDAVEGGEAYVTILAGGGGGLEANLNRWRRQFGLQPLSADEITSLPRVNVLGLPGVLVDITGPFAGMGDQPAREDWRLVGAIVDLPQALVTVKMTGPAAALDAEIPRFTAFGESLAFGGTAMATHAGGLDPSQLPEGHPPLEGLNPAGMLPDGHPPIDQVGGQMGQMPASGAPDSNFKWTVPDGWRAGPEKMMRLATFFVGDDDATEISVIPLGGNGGGMVPNIQRWYEQMGQDAPSADAIAKLPTVKILAHDCPLVEVTGSFSGMGRSDLTEAALIGSICELPDQALFIKMTGPSQTVLAEKDSFVAFCLSLTH